MKIPEIMNPQELRNHKALIIRNIRAARRRKDLQHAIYLCKRWCPLLVMKLPRN